MELNYKIMIQAKQSSVQIFINVVYCFCDFLFLII